MLFFLFFGLDIFEDGCAEMMGYLSREEKSVFLVFAGKDGSGIGLG